MTTDQQPVQAYVVTVHDLNKFPGALIEVTTQPILELHKAGYQVERLSGSTQYGYRKLSNWYVFKAEEWPQRSSPHVVSGHLVRKIPADRWARIQEIDR